MHVRGISRVAFAVAIACSLTACPGRLERPERFGLGGSGDAGSSPGPDGGSVAPGTDAGPSGPSAAEILAMRCAGSGCHGALSPALGLDLESPGLRDRMVDVAAVGCSGQTLVVAGDPASSYLFTKMSSDTPACGSRMPLLRDALPADELATVEAWIAGL